MMIKQNYEELVDKIVEKSGKGKSEIDQKIDEKLKQLSGLISKEGAAHIVANQLGIKLVEQTSGKLQIKNILAGMRDVETTGKVLRTFPVRTFNVDGREGKVGNLIMGDETGTIRLVMWGDQATHLDNISEILSFTVNEKIDLFESFKEAKLNGEQIELKVKKEEKVAVFAGDLSALD